jgi:chromosome partitioning protein
MRTIAVVNQKGGCGKTTTAINLAGFLARDGRRTLVVDMDPQAHSTLGLLRHPPADAPTLFDVFARALDGRGPSLGEVALPVSDGLAVAPSDVRLSAVQESLAGRDRREHILSRQIRTLGAAYDYVIVDCPPGIGLLTFNALLACDEAIVPVEPSFFALDGVGRLLETLDVLARQTGHAIAWRAVVTMYAGRTAYARAVVEDLRTHLAGRCYDITIRHSVKLAEAASHGQPIATYDTRCAGFEDYRALAREVLAMDGSIGESRARTADGAASGPRPTSDGVVFTIQAPEAHSVQLVGDFNGWTADDTDMQPAGPIWTRVLKLEPGRYRYRYIVDGQWLSDPLNELREPTPFGGDNSVLELADIPR